MAPILTYAAETEFFDEGRYRADRPRVEWLRSTRNVATTCRFCGRQMGAVRNEDDPDAGFFNLIYVCDTCGWWNAEAADTMQPDPDTVVIREALIVGILRSFDIEDDSIPTDVLWSEIVRHPHAATASSPTAWEHLVGDVLRSVRACEVRHVGRTGDGGIDLFLLEGDVTTAVQVKRRTSLDRTEGVELVGSSSVLSCSVIYVRAFW